jgi:hypothetical protein
VGCRKTFPKRELLRFVHNGSGAVMFDEAQRLPGRGYYLCPQHDCLSNAWKNRKGKAFLKDEETARRLVPSVLESLLGSVERILGGSGNTTIAVEDLRTGDILLIREDMPEAGRCSLSESARTRGADVFDVPPGVLNWSEGRVIKHDSPKISPMLRNLRFYERLSSKGREL